MQVTESIFYGVGKLLILERETGIEPATNSLEGWAYFENTERMCHWGWILAI
jgi:hypothetical protein